MKKRAKRARERVEATAEESVAEQSAEEQSAEEQPAEEQSVEEEKPVEETPDEADDNPDDDPDPDDEAERDASAPPKAEPPRAPAPKKSFLGRHWLNLGIVALAAAATLYFFVFDKKSVTSNEAEARRKMVFPAWREKDVATVTIKRAEEELVLTSSPAKNGGKSWDITLNGAHYTGDDQAIDMFLSTMQFAEVRREVPKGSVDLHQFGLDAPAETIDVAMGDLSFRLLVGGPGAGEAEVYASIGDRVVTITPALARSLSPSADALRSKRFVPFFSTDIAKLTIEGEGGTRAFERATWSGGRGSGFRLAGGGVRVDGDLLNNVFIAFGRMQADAFVGDQEADAASSPRVTVTLVSHEGERAVLVLGGECPTKKGQVLAIRREPTRLNVCVSSAVVDALTTPAAAFEDTHVLGAALDEVVEVKVVDGDKKLEIARSGNGFKMRSPVDKPVDGDRGNALLSEMLTMRGELEDVTFSASAPIQIRVLSEGGLTSDGKDAKREETVSLYRSAGDGGPCVAVRGEDERKLIVPCSALHTFAANDLLVRDLSVLGEKPERVTSMDVTSPGKSQSVKRKDSSWELVSPTAKGLLADDGLVGELAESFARLTTSRWVAEKDDGSFGLETPRITLTAKLLASEKGEARTVKLTIGSKTDDGSYGQIDGDPAVFIVPKGLEDDATRWLVARSSLRVTIDTVEKVTFQADDGKSVELQREGKELKATASTAKAKEIAAALAAALDDLLPVAAVTIGPPEDFQGFKKPLLTITLKGPADTSTITIGAGDTFERVSVHYARRSGVDATFVVPQSVVRQILDALAQ